jgi:hypothetical protein
MLGMFTSHLEMTKGMGVQWQVLLEFALEFLHEVVNKVVVKVFTTEVGVTSGSLDLEDALLNSQEGHIKGSSTQIKISTFLLPETFLSSPYAMVAAAGSLMICKTLRPEIMPASFVAWCCESLK